jgi:lipid-A-disaccharide synthase
LKHAAVAAVASGTATVEAALVETPMVVVYRVGRLTYALGRPFVRLPFFSMVNLIAGRRLVPELIQGDMTSEAICAEVEALLEPRAAEEMKRGLREVKAKLGGKGASARAAEAVLTFLEARQSLQASPSELS